jgi:diaminopimelate epimerase
VEIKFTKMHGAGNDFVVIDNRSGSFPVDDTTWIARTATRRTGIGCDGIVILAAGSGPDQIHMRFFNPDGHEAELCGNAARCVARYAAERELAPPRMIIETVAGPIPAEYRADEAIITMPPPHAWHPALPLPLTALPFAAEATCSAINTGVPHVVLLCEDTAAIDATALLTAGLAIRQADRFAPAGTNVNFVTVTDRHHARMRTYERGVEAETLACGTGATAVAVTMARRGLMDSPIHLHTQGGDTLTIELPDGATGAQVRMRGPATYVYDGSVNYPSTSTRNNSDA